LVASSGPTVARSSSTRSATHRDLEERIRTGTFRADLFYRLNVVALRLPALRDRREDIPELVEHFLVRFARRYERPVRSLSREAMDALIKYRFPGNVRELENVIEQATVLTTSDQVGVADLPAKVRGAPVAGERALHAFGSPALEELSGNLPGFLAGLEQRIVMAALARSRGNQSQAARELGLTESGLRYKLKRWQDEGISAPSMGEEQGADPPTV